VSDQERIARLFAAKDRLNAELRAVEDGTLPFMEGRRTVTPDLIAEQFKVSVQAANNRLLRLHRVGILSRRSVNKGKGGGRSYVYKVEKGALHG
jgi:predicted ArsR family transcriptional regulator